MWLKTRGRLRHGAVLLTILGVLVGSFAQALRDDPTPQKAYAAEPAWFEKDLKKPYIGKVSPYNPINRRTPTVWAQVWDVDSGLDTERTAVFVDGKRLPGQVSSTGIFEQQVTEHLSIGTHQATIKAWDKEGNYSQADWDFEVRGHQIDQAPNQSQRSGRQPRVIVIHATAGNYPYDYQALMGARKVSSHFYVRKSGYIVRMVPDRMSAWHAGKSSFKGISAYGSLNSESLGIEIESRGRGPADYTPAQIEAVAELVNHWQKKYGISDAYVTGHSEITARKSDPKGFPWGTFWGNVTSLRAATT